MGSPFIQLMDQRLSMGACRKPEEADAQALRAAVLIDEMGGDGGGASIVLELRSGHQALVLSRYACSNRVFTVPTTQMNARRCAPQIVASRAGFDAQTLQIDREADQTTR